MLEIFREAGWVAYPLGVCSIIALGVTLERLYSLAQFKSLEEKAFRALKASMGGGNAFPNAEGIEGAPVSQVVETIRELRGHDDETLRYAAEISLAEQRQRLRRYLNFLATIGSTAPFIGLFGTVLGVMGAFKGMSVQSGGEAMAQGISEALSATALGLAVAVPSVIAYNLFLVRVQNMMLEIQSHVAFLIPMLNRSTTPTMTAQREDITMRMPAQGVRN